MNTKNDVDVIIGGKKYTLCGYESSDYLHRVAAHINEKYTELKAQPGYNRLDADMKNVLLSINLVDDIFKAQGQAKEQAQQKEELEKEIFDMKHKLMSGQEENAKLQKKVDDYKESYEHDQHKIIRYETEIISQRSRRKAAEAAKEEAEKANRDVEKAKNIAEEAKENALSEKEDAQAQRDIAKAARESAEAEKQKALEEKKKALEEKNAAEAEKKAALKKVDEAEKKLAKLEKELEEVKKKLELAEHGQQLTLESLDSNIAQLSDYKSGNKRNSSNRKK